MITKTTYQKYDKLVVQKLAVGAINVLNNTLQIAIVVF